MEVSLNQPLIIFSLTFGLVAIAWQFPGFLMSFREIADSLLYIDNAYEIWIDLRDRFHQSNGPQIFQIILIIT